MAPRLAVCIAWITVLRPLAGRQIELPERFLPSVAFVAWHRQQVFIG